MKKSVTKKLASAALVGMLATGTLTACEGFKGAKEGIHGEKSGCKGSHGCKGSSGCEGKSSCKGHGSCGAK